MGNPEQSIIDFDEALRLDPESGETLLYRGAARAQRGIYQGAVEDLTAALRIGVDDAEAHAQRALAYTGLELDEEAESDFEQAVTLGVDAATLRSAITETKSNR